MGERAIALADRFNRARLEFLTTIEGYSPAQMRSRCEGEQCSVTALASHVAKVHTLAADLVQAAASGGTLPSMSMDDVNRMNLEQFTRDVNRDKAAILRDLRANGEHAEQVLRQLSDADLDRASRFPLLGGEVTTQQIVELVMIGDIEGHLTSIAAAGSASN
jgi:hypothetical protein